MTIPAADQLWPAVCNNILLEWQAEQVLSLCSLARRTFKHGQGNFDSVSSCRFDAFVSDEWIPSPTFSG